MSEKLRRHELECVRLASECLQLAGDVRGRALEAHFLRMAQVWTALADWRPGEKMRSQTLH